MMYQGKTELSQASTESTASVLLMLFYTVIIFCVCVFFAFALDYMLESF